jgi:hypothetical protein
MRRSLVLLVASGAAIVGLVLLAIAFIGVGTKTLEMQQTSDSPCLQAYTQDLPGSDVRYTVFPPQSICTYDVDGSATSVVLASAPPLTAGLGAVLALGGAAVCVTILLWPRLRRTT